ncbi:MAG TPA: hypothetical protein VFI77_01095, partial [Gemmatimonadales bacterium]|nr:hypothetical protein [Gemmatimonadales bacterium]
MWRWTVGLTLAAAACSPGDTASRAPMEQGRLYTTWLYGSQFDKLWDRFSPEMRQTFGSVSELASFAGLAVRRLGAEHGVIDERVERASPFQVYSRTASFDHARHRMLLEWSLGPDGQVTGLVLR